jgi:hypothetical protein
MLMLFVYGIVYNQISLTRRLATNIEDEVVSRPLTAVRNELKQSSQPVTAQGAVAEISARDATASRPGARDERPHRRSVNSLFQSNYSESTTGSTLLPYHIVELHQKETFMWQGRQRRLCDRLKKETQKKKGTWMFLRSRCQALHAQHQHGNLLFGLYAMHVAALAHDSDLIFVCDEQKKYANLFWWLQSTPQTVELKRSLLQNFTLVGSKATSPKPSRRAACFGMGKNPLHYAADLAQYDLRRMALAIYGSRSERMDPKQYKSDQDKLPVEPLYPEEELDSVAIHFRCGDVLSNLSQGSKANYGLVPFFVYRNVLKEAEDDDVDRIDSIGIVTAPFDAGHLREQDAKHASKCQELVESLRDYLQSGFANARVTIRNSPNDTIPMVYSRLILATQVSICIRSTFCTFPTLSSFAKKRVFLEGGVNYFLADVDDTGLDVRSTMDTPYLLSHEIHSMGWNGTKAWLLQNGTNSTTNN